MPRISMYKLVYVHANVDPAYWRIYAAPDTNR